jgi:hypothetical protein
MTWIRARSAIETILLASSGFVLALKIPQAWIEGAYQNLIMLTFLTFMFAGLSKREGGVPFRWFISVQVISFGFCLARVAVKSGWIH